MNKSMVQYIAATVAGTLAGIIVVASPIGVQAGLPALTVLSGLRIAAMRTKNVSCVAGVCTPTKAKAVLNVSDLAKMLAVSDVTLRTSSTAAPDIQFATPMSWTSGFQLNLDSFRSVQIIAPLSDTGTGGLAITTNDGGTGGALSFVAGGSLTFPGLDNRLSINGNAYTLVSDIVTLANDMAANPAGNYALAMNYDAEGDGAYPAAPVATVVQGTFEGLGNAIGNLTILDTSNVGDSRDALFGEIGATGAVRDMILANVNVSYSGTPQTNDVVAAALVAENGGVVVNSSAAGRVSVTTGTVGGLVGRNANQNASVSSSHANVGVAAGPSSFAGGLAGLNSAGAISLSYATGSVSGSGDGDEVGGLLGVNSSGGLVSESYATGAATMAQGDVGDVGGLIGALTTSAKFLRSYAVGAVSPANNCKADSPCAGGLVGEDLAKGGKQSYWDLISSGIGDPSQGSGNVSNDKGIVGLSTSQFLSTLPKGFSKKIWAETPGVNNGYPYMIENPPQ